MSQKTTKSVKSTKTYKTNKTTAKSFFGSNLDSSSEDDVQPLTEAEFDKGLFFFHDPQHLRLVHLSSDKPEIETTE